MKARYTTGGLLVDNTVGAKYGQDIIVILKQPDSLFRLICHVDPPLKTRQRNPLPNPASNV